VTIQFLSLQGSGGTAVPFDRRLGRQTQQTATDPAESLRLKRYEEHWRFYQGTQWAFSREEGQALVTANYCRTVVNKKASWLVGKGQIIDVPQGLRAVTLPVLKRTWRLNAEQKLLFEMAIQGGVTGDVCVVVTWQEPTHADLIADPGSRGTCRLRLVPAERCFPEWDPLNKDRLLSLRIVTEVPDTTPVAQVPSRMGNVTPLRSNPSAVRKRRYIEVLTAETLIEGWEGENPTSRKNDLGEIPFVHIPNEVFPGEYYGLSDLDGVIDLQREFNEKATDISDIVNYHAAPITIITGAKAANLERGANKIWSGLPEKASVQNLSLNGDLGASHKYLETVREIIFDVANVPAGSLGRTQPISNTSKAALEVAFQPLVETTARKAAPFVEGMQEINRLILRWDQLVHQKYYPSDLCGECGGRIVTFRKPGRDGVERLVQKCYRVDPQTLDFLHPDDVKVNVVIEHSFGNETRLLPYGRVKKLWGKKSPSYWDPESMIDKEEEAEAQKKHQEKLEEEQAAAEEAEYGDGGADGEEETAE
jgi:hypothetical protein